MKKILSSIVAFALLCGIAGAIGIEWGVDNLYLPGDPADVIATSGNYGTDVGDYILKLVWVGDGTMAEVNGVQQYEEFTVVGSASLATIPAEVAGSVSGSTEVSQVGTYVMLLYNNYGGYYSLAAGANPTSIVVDQEMLDAPYEFEDPSLQITSGNVYRGALVPEPGTAALALAGIALLFRRRKA